MKGRSSSKGSGGKEPSRAREAALEAEPGSLPWTTVPLDAGESGGFDCFEEVTGYDVVTAVDSKGRKTVGFRRIDSGAGQASLVGSKRKAAGKPAADRAPKRAAPSPSTTRDSSPDDSEPQDGIPPSPLVESDRESRAGTPDEPQDQPQGPAAVLGDGPRPNNAPKKPSRKAGTKTLLPRDFGAEDNADGPEPPVVGSTGKEPARKRVRRVKPVAVAPTPEDLATPWSALDLDKRLLAALAALGLAGPTPIQSVTLPYALSGRDVIGAAETGSGKTLAFGLGLLQRIIQDREGLVGLIMAPTRELAAQIRDALHAVVKATPLLSETTQESPAADPSTATPRAGTRFAPRIMTVMGGMSIEKQLRQLAQKPHIIIATPGRLYELTQQSPDLVAMMTTQMQALVIDEADRMLEKGSFMELGKILALLTDSGPASSRPLPTPPAPVQVLIFSATLAENDSFGKKKPRGAPGKPKKKPATGNATFAALLAQLPFQTSQPPYVNLLPKNLLSTQVHQSKIHMQAVQKPSVLVTLLSLYPTSTMIFCNTIPALKKLKQLLLLLFPADQERVWTLHSGMNQKARLTCIEGFKASALGGPDTRNILLASDVAARGLDIPRCQLVIHYDTPFTLETYIHRSGRTGRGANGAEGVSVALVTPADEAAFGRILRGLAGGAAGPGLANFPLDAALHQALQKRVALAEQIAEVESKGRQVTQEGRWMHNLAAEADMEVPSDMEEGDEDGDARARAAAAAKQWHAQLRAELAKTVRAPQLRGKFLGAAVLEAMAQAQAAPPTPLPSPPPPRVATKTFKQGVVQKPPSGAKAGQTAASRAKVGSSKVRRKVGQKSALPSMAVGGISRFQGGTVLADLLVAKGQ